jgi:hypothetical protein
MEKVTAHHKSQIHAALDLYQRRGEWDGASVQQARRVLARAGYVWKPWIKEEVLRHMRDEQLRSRERVVYGLTKGGGTVVLSTWSKPAAYETIRGVHAVTPSGARRSTQIRVASSVEDALRQGKTWLENQYGPIEWSTSKTAHRG